MITENESDGWNCSLGPEILALVQFWLRPKVGEVVTSLFVTIVNYAASAARQISGIVALLPPSLPVLNCPFLIFSINSIPLIVTTAEEKFFRPTIARIRCFTRRWSCSIPLFKYLLVRVRTRLGSSPFFLGIPGS